MANIDRRDFLKLIGAGGVGAGAGFLLADSIKHPVEHLIPYPVPPEEYSPGIVTWYNSVCGMCSAGCGISVRIREGRAKKIEGNPLHPVSQGALCALGQAGLQVLYNPDRITGPLQVSGERGAGTFAELTWDDALRSAAGRLAPLVESGRGDRVWMLSSGGGGHLGRLQREFMDALGSQNLVRYDFAHPQTLYAANRRFFGEDALPYYDLKNCDYLLSFGADYLGTWISPVLHSLGFGHSRQGTEGSRGRFVQIEPRLSLTGASADEWIPARPGTEGLLALGLAHQLVAGGAYEGPDADAWNATLASYGSARVAAETGVPEDTVKRLADAFAHHHSALAIGGGAAASHRNGVDTLVAVNALNYLAGNIGKPGGLVFNPAPAAGGSPGQEGYRGALALIEAAGRSEVEVLILSDANPLYSLPAAAGFEAALQQIPLVLSLSSFMDETTARADLILPSHTYLESWGDDFPEPGVGFPVGAVSQPVVAPLYNTRASGDTLLALAQQSGALLPWASMEERVKDGWRAIHARGSWEDEPELQDFDGFWTALLESGVWGETAHREHTGFSPAPEVIDGIGMPSAEFSGAAQSYPFVLHPYLSQTFNDGRGANLPWMQELADPMTAVVYGCWVEVNPKTAARLGLSEGDVVEVASPHGQIRAPVFVYPAIMPDVVAMPIGQGHTEYGRYAKGRGANPIQILTPEMEPESGALAWAGTRVQLTKTGERAKLVHTGGESRQLGRNIIQTEGAGDVTHAGGPAIPIKVVPS